MWRPGPCFLLTVVSPISGTWEVPSKHLLTLRRNCLESWFSPALPALWHIILAIVPHLISPKFKFFPSPVWLIWKTASFKNVHHSIYPISHGFLKNSCWFSSLWGMCLYSILLNLAWPGPWWDYRVTLYDFWGEVPIHNQHQLPDMWRRLYDDSSPNHCPAATEGETLVRTRQTAAPTSSLLLSH